MVILVTYIWLKIMVNNYSVNIAYMDPMGKGMIYTFSLHDLRRAARDQSWPGPRSR